MLRRKPEHYTHIRETVRVQATVRIETPPKYSKFVAIAPVMATVVFFFFVFLFFFFKYSYSLGVNSTSRLLQTTESSRTFLFLILARRAAGRFSAPRVPVSLLQLFYARWPYSAHHHHHHHHHHHEKQRDRKHPCLFVFIQKASLSC